jgi:hypothetical protein
MPAKQSNQLLVMALLINDTGFSLATMETVEIIRKQSSPCFWWKANTWATACSSKLWNSRALRLLAAVFALIQLPCSASVTGQCSRGLT